VQSSSSKYITRKKKKSISVSVRKKESDKPGFLVLDAPECHVAEVRTNQAIIFAVPGAKWKKQKKGWEIRTPIPRNL